MSVVPYAVEEKWMRPMGRLQPTSAGFVAVYTAEDIARVFTPFLELGMQRYSELFEAAGLGEAKDSVFIQDATELLKLLEAP